MQSKRFLVATVLLGFSAAGAVQESPLAPGSGAGATPCGPAVEECLRRVAEFHGTAGPWAVAGYRMGTRALRELGLPRHAFSLLVIHRAPAEVQFSCVADGLQAATGATPGKLNLRVEEVPFTKLSTTVIDRKTGRACTFNLRPAFVESILNLPHERLEAEGRRVAGLRDDEIFSVTTSTVSGSD
jgi:formylmethanofuran dehydrogenase subunit E